MGSYTDDNEFYDNQTWDPGLGPLDGKTPDFFLDSYDGGEPVIRFLPTDEKPERNFFKAADLEDLTAKWASIDSVASELTKWSSIIAGTPGTGKSMPTLWGTSPGIDIGMMTALWGSTSEGIEPVYERYTRRHKKKMLNPVGVQVLTEDPYDDKLMLNYSDVLAIHKAPAEEHPTFKILDHEKFEKIKPELEKLGSLKILSELD